ncbi:sucrose-phosphate phosphatase [Lusitaniella coriacea]|uniref:sucrose-phosphate phosphatase n=1 Tax=Lusitaniella coriacea TaxID=1983105 RepID=UPI003CE93D83
MTPFLFVTDLDNTLVGDRAALETLNQRLSQHRQEFGTKIVYATGRSRFLYQQLTEEQTLLHPDALVASVGTAIYPNPDEDTLDPQWVEILSPGWNRDAILAIAANYDALSPQSDTEQGEFKASYHLAQDAAPEALPALESALTEQGLNIQLVYSGAKDLDILPKNGNKGLALEFLQQKWGFSPERTVACGDSGNDIALFAQRTSKGIIVGNAMSELRQWYEDNRTDDLYFADAFYSGGILEGLAHFDFIS